MIITSAENSRIAEVKKLTEKKFRKSTGLYLIEGERLVRDAIRYGAEITEIFVKESAAEKFSFEKQVEVADKVFAKISDTVSSQGVVAVVKKRENKKFAPQGNCLVLDGLQDPGNVGTLLRTAAACGFCDVYAVDTVDLYSPKVLRSAMSAHFCVRLHESHSLAEVLDNLGDDVQIVAADMNGQNVFETTFHKRVALIVGNEGNGISKLSKISANVGVSLPMKKDFE